jgi:hypothetical protein
VAGNAFAAFSGPELNIDAQIEWNTAGVYEGRRRVDHNCAPHNEIGVPIRGSIHGSRCQSRHQL